MSRQSKIKRNDPCPCMSGKKFKTCCSGKIDWERIIQQGRDYRPYLSVRGRNLYFVNRISEALQLDKLGTARNLKDYKSAFTADAVRKIHEAIMEVWPPNIDIFEVLKRSARDVSGLYIGDYQPEYLARGIVRHSIYANRILLIDPFIYPRSVRDEFNPIVNPAQYRAQTLKNVNLWLALLPWIEAGIVEVVRPPADFDHQLNWDFMNAQLKKFEENAELKNASKKSIDELSARHTKKFIYQQLLLGAPDSYLKSKFEELELGTEGGNFDDFLKSINQQREQDPDFLEPMGPESEAQLFTITSGASYPSATMTAGITGSYLFTDIYVKWREIELDRESHSAENKVWAPFAMALQNAPLRYLNNLRLEHALTLRREGRLESLRGFLGRVWKDASAEDQFDSANAILLAEELAAQIRDAEQEWKKIDTDLLKIVGGVALGGLLAAGPLIAAGHANFLAAAVAVAGLGPVIHSTLQRRSFPDRFPAAFFMKIDENDT
jgi:AraC-like DNA-binding protein